MFTYPPEFQQAAAIELDWLQGTGQAPHVVTMMDDYGKTRATIRTCQ